jgi:hypothetical protein
LVVELALSQHVQSRQPGFLLILPRPAASPLDQVLADVSRRAALSNTFNPLVKAVCQVRM